MKVLTWNINGIRAAGRGRSMKDILDSLEADVICLQETKVTREYNVDEVNLSTTLKFNMLSGL